MTQWTNKAPSPHNSVLNDINANPNYKPVPKMQQTTGTVNGTSPTSFQITAPHAVDLKKAIGNLPTFLTIQH